MGQNSYKRFYYEDHRNEIYDAVRKYAEHGFLRHNKWIHILPAIVVEYKYYKGGTFYVKETKDSEYWPPNIFFELEIPDLEIFVRWDIRDALKCYGKYTNYNQERVDKTIGQTKETSVILYLKRNDEEGFALFPSFENMHDSVYNTHKYLLSHIENIKSIAPTL